MNVRAPFVRSAVRNPDLGVRVTTSIPCVQQNLCVESKVCEVLVTSANRSAAFTWVRTLLLLFNLCSQSFESRERAGARHVCSPIRKRSPGCALCYFYLICTARPLVESRKRPDAWGVGNPSPQALTGVRTRQG